jgi:O-acetyl-ADP-ribose deacetylase (regulator of RNase III)
MAGIRRNEAELLAARYRSCLELALAHGVQSIALPAISTGVFGFPLVPACRIAVAECSSFLARDLKLEIVTLVAFSRADEVALRDAVLEHAAQSLPR